MVLAERRWRGERTTRNEPGHLKPRGPHPDKRLTAARVWTIAAERMKMNREHRVPLSPRALEVLDAARSLADGNPLVFPNRWGNRIRDTFV